MAIKWVNPRALSNGSGNSFGDALNTFAGLSWGSDTYLVTPGTLNEKLTFAASGARVIGADPSDRPIINWPAADACVNLNSTTGNELAYVVVTGSNAAAPNAGIRVTGSGHSIHDCHVYNNRHGIHVNSSAGNHIYRNFVDVGRADDLAQGWGIRLNGVGATGNRLMHNEIVSSRATRALYVQGSVFGHGIEIYSGVSNVIARNIIHAAMCDQIIARQNADNNVIEANYCYGSGMLDGIDVLNSHGNMVRLNTILHPGDVPGHAGPCMAIGDDYGMGVAATNTAVLNNLLWANNRLCMSIRPLGAGFSSQGNRLYVKGISGDAVCNVDEGGGFVATNMATWLGKGWVTGDTQGDPVITADGRPMVGSPLLTGGVDIGYFRDIERRQSRRHVGAFGRAMVRAPA